MADIELVIKIPEEYYDYIKEHQYMDRYYDTREKSKIFCAIKNGTPLDEYCENCIYMPTESEDE